MAGRRGQVRAVMVGVGAAFDFLAGTVPRAPRGMRSLGLEWLPRLLQQPRRNEGLLDPAKARKGQIGDRDESLSRVGTDWQGPRQRCSGSFEDPQRGWRKPNRPGD